MLYLYILLLIFIFLCFFIKIDGYDIINIINKLYILCNGNSNKAYYNINTKWAIKLQNNYKVIYNEFLDYIKEHETVSFRKIDKVQIMTDISSIPWPVIFLRVYNNNTNKIKYFPKTYEIISSISDCTLAMFSVMPPNKKIPKHVGPYKGVLRYHLGLKTPKDNTNCFIAVNDIKYSWKDGEDVLFDDTLEHYVENNTDEYRVILFLDIKRNFNNIFLDTINSIILRLAQFNDTVIEIVNNVNNN
jgi:aspartyl/asparaginyl beta-hydroxylase (cupin superfamily)